MTKRIEWMCEPCGSCPRCRAKARARLERTALRAEVRRLRALLVAARRHVDEASRCHEGDAMPDPCDAAARRVLRRVDRALARNH